MTYLQSAAGFLIGDRNTWQANATDTSTGAHPPGWTNAQLWSETATEWMNDRNAWYNQAQAWYTERYNQGHADGYAAGAASKTTSSVSTGTFTNRTGMNNINTFLSVATLTAPRTGHCLIHGMQRVGFSGAGSGKVRLLINGGVVATSPNVSGANSDGNVHATTYYNGSINSGDVVTLEVAGTGSGGANNSGGGHEFIMTVGSV